MLCGWGAIPLTALGDSRIAGDADHWGRSVWAEETGAGTQRAARKAKGVTMDPEGEFDQHKELLDSLPDGVYCVDRDRRITYWNRASQKLTGYRASDVVGKCCRDGILMHVDDQGARMCGERCPLAATIRDGLPRQVDLYLHHRDGQRVPVSVRSNPLCDPTAQITGAVETFSDNSAQEALTEKIKELENALLLDPLTGVGNRRHIELSLRDRLAEMQRYGSPFGLLFMDIDHFKAINDVYGHDVGDDVLRMVAKTLALNLRPFDHLGRWGGEEFVALVVRNDEAQVRSIAERCRVLVEQSGIYTGSDPVRATISVGATLAEPRDTTESLVKRADQLMYHSKITGRNRVSLKLDDSAGAPLERRTA